MLKGVGPRTLAAFVVFATLLASPIVPTTVAQQGDAPVAGADLTNMTLAMDGDASVGRPITVQMGFPEPVAARWTLFVIIGNESVFLANGSELPAKAQFMMDEGTYGLLFVGQGANGTVERTLTFTVGPRIYDDIIAADVFPILFAALLMLGLAIWILVRDRTKPINVAFAALFIARGVADIVLALWTNTGSLNIRPSETLDAATSGLARHLHPMTSVLVLFAALYFLYAYLAQNNARLAIRHRYVGMIAAAATGALVLLYLLVPSIWWRTDGAGTPTPGGWLFAITGLYYPLYAVFALLLFRESGKDLPDERRAGAFYSGLGLLFLPVFTGAGEFVFVDVLDFFERVAPGGGLRSSLGAAFEVGHWAAVLAWVPIALAGIVLARGAFGASARPGGRLYFGLFLGAVALPLLSLGVAVAVFFAGPDPVTAAYRSFSVFKIFEGIWTIPYPVLVAYGLTRYQAASQQANMRQQIRRFGMASIFFTVFFSVSEGLEAVASSRFGPAVGLASAAAMTMILGPVQARLQRRIASQADPREETSQEIRFYTEQVRRTLLDGHIGDVERKFLLNLQDTMGISVERAAAIEHELVAERRAMGPPGAPA